PREGAQERAAASQRPRRQLPQVRRGPKGPRASPRFRGSDGQHGNAGEEGVAMAFGGSSGGGVRSDINITPLVDVVLVLLIIFMVMTPTLLKEVDVKVPDKAEVETNATPSSTEEIVVTITNNGRIQLNHEPIDEARLADRVRDAMVNR